MSVDLLRTMIGNAPCTVVGVTGVGGSSDESTSTRSSGHGMPCAESSGRDGDWRMKGGPPRSGCFLFLRRKLSENMAT